MTPKRIQRTRQKGYRMPEGAVYVGRPTVWGNPFAVGATIHRSSRLFPYLAKTVPGRGFLFEQLTAHTARSVVDAYAWWLYEQPSLMLRLPELRGKDLCCWCPLSSPCHADVLIELAAGESA